MFFIIYHFALTLENNHFSYQSSQDWRYRETEAWPWETRGSTGDGTALAALETQYTGGARTDGLLLGTAAGVEWSCPEPMCVGDGRAREAELLQPFGAKDVRHWGTRFWNYTARLWFYLSVIIFMPWFFPLRVIKYWIGYPKSPNLRDFVILKRNWTFEW